MVGCGSPLLTTDLIIGSAPFSIYAITNNPKGYTWDICYSCVILPIGGLLPSFTFTKEIITIIADPLDCSNSLEEIPFSFQNPI